MKLQQKIKAMEKLKAAGIKDEKQLAAVGFETLIKLPGISIPELNVIAEIKKNVKTNHLFSYLLETDERGNSDDTDGNNHSV